MADPTATPLFGVPTSAPTPTPAMALSSAPVGARPAPLPEMRKPKRHGFIDDALGFLGDFLLSRLRMGTPYRDAKKAEKLQIASEGFDQNPEEAFQRMAAVDWDAATKFRDQSIDNNRLAAQNASIAETREGRLALSREAQINRNRGISASYLGGLDGVPESDRPANYSRLRSKLLNAFGDSDPELSDLLPETYDPVMIDAFRSSSVPEGTQRQQNLTNTRIENQNEQFYAAEAGKDRRQSVAEGGKDRRQSVSEGGKDRRQSVSEAGKDKVRTTTTTSSDGKTTTTHSSRNPPKQRRVRVQNGKVYDAETGAFIRNR